MVGIAIAKRHRSHTSLAIGNECVPELSLSAKSYPFDGVLSFILGLFPFYIYVRGLYSVYSLKSYHYTATRDKQYTAVDFLDSST